MTRSPRHKNPDRPLTQPSGAQHTYLGRHRKIRTRAIGTCLQVVLIGILVFGSAGHIHRPAERAITEIHRDT